MLTRMLSTKTSITAHSFWCAHIVCDGNGPFGKRRAQRSSRGECAALNMAGGARRVRRAPRAVRGEAGEGGGGLPGWWNSRGGGGGGGGGGLPAPRGVRAGGGAPPA